MAISKITDEQKETIRNLTSLNLPDNPSAAGWRPDAIRAALSKGAGDGAIELAELVNAVIDEMNEELEDKVDEEEGKGLSKNDFTDALKAKLVAIEAEANKTIVDSSLSGSSENPVQNKVVKVALDGKVDKETGKSLSTNDYTTAEKTKLSGIETGANKTIIDSALSGSSENPVQNKVVKDALDTLTAESGYSLDFSMDSNYVLTVTLKNKEGTSLSTKTVDLPIEWLLLGASISGDNLILTFRTGENETQTVTTDLSGILSTALAGKVDVVSGKALSTNDFTDALKEKLDGIETQANKTVVDDALSDSSENPVQNKVVKGALDGKANTEGVYDDFISGTAKQILAMVGVVEKVPYNFRTSAGAHDIDSNRETDKIIGGTVVWNQLVNDVSTTVPTGHIYFANINGVSTVAESDGTALTTDPATDNVHDLTRLFNSSTIADYIYSLETDTAGAGVAWFRALFPKAYYSYNAGQLMSVKTTSHDMVEFNAYNHATGTAILLGGNEYQITGTYTALSYVDINGDSETVTPDANGKFIPTNNGTLTVTGGNDTDTCVHLVWSGSRDGEYEPYVKHSYALDPNLELRGFPKLATDNSLYYDGDEYEGSGQVTRKYGIKTYSAEEIRKASPQTNIQYFVVNKPIDAKVYGSVNFADTCLCSKFDFGAHPTGGAWNDASLVGKIYNSRDQAKFYIGYPVGTTLEEAKADLNGMQIVYKLATHTVDFAAPFANPQIVDDYGTEQYVDGREVEIPVGHETLYQANLRDKLQHLPSLYSVNGVVQSGLFHIQQDGTNMVLVPDTSDTRLNALEALVPVYEDYTIATTDWTALASSDPYDYSATVTATHTIGSNTVVELVNNNPVLFAEHGFAIGAVSGQNITIYAIGTPSASVSLEVAFHG